MENLLLLSFFKNHIKWSGTYFGLDPGDGCVHIFLTVLQHFNDRLLCVRWLGESSLDDRRCMLNILSLFMKKKKKKDQTQSMVISRRTYWCCGIKQFEIILLLFECSLIP